MTADSEAVAAFRVNERPIANAERGKLTVASNGRISVPARVLKVMAASVDADSCPVVHKGYVYVVGERAVCVDLGSGKIVWEEKKAGCSCSSAVLADVHHLPASLCDISGSVSGTVRRPGLIAHC